MINTEDQSPIAQRLVEIPGSMDFPFKTTLNFDQLVKWLDSRGDIYQSTGKILDELLRSDLVRDIHTSANDRIAVGLMT